jgi:hypothetical protein
VTHYSANLRRIPADLVVDAFRKTKLRPIRGEFLDRGRSACCAMTAVVIHELRPIRDSINKFNVGLKAKRHLGVSHSYFAGFIAGWDSMEGAHEESSAEFVRGLSDGKSAWEMVLDRGLVKE